MTDPVVIAVARVVRDAPPGARDWIAAHETKVQDALARLREACRGKAARLIIRGTWNNRHALVRFDSGRALRSWIPVEGRCYDRDLTDLADLAAYVAELGPDGFPIG